MFAFLLSLLGGAFSFSRFSASEQQDSLALASTSPLGPRPVSGDVVGTPLLSDLDAEEPRDGHDVETPHEEHDTETPHKGHDTDAPHDGHDTEAPHEGHDAEAPHEGHDAEAPHEEHDTETPHKGHDTDAPHDGHDTEAPHDGHGGGSGSMPLPTTQAEIDAFVAAVRAGTEVHVHDADSPKLSEHEALLDLVPPAQATHIAIAHGSWFNPANWHNGEVPGDNAKVIIPENVYMEYDQVSDARLFTLRVDGHLDFATDTNSEMIIDTFVVSPTGTLTIGTEDAPIDPNVNVDIIFANNGAIDVNWDPNLLSRGIISHGDTQIHGAVKDSHEKVTDAPMKGDTFVKFAEIPEGWQVGDTIVIAGTHYDGYRLSNGEKIHHPPEDEIRVISSIEGTSIHFEDPLIHDHDTPRDDLHTSVANYTRNVSFSTEDPDTAEIHERGHAMFMHSDDVDIRYAEFHELGRTDKSESALDAADFDTIASDSNVKGRYGLHLHRLGTENVDDPAIIQGNAVFGSPGWGFVHHDSNAILDNNASYDTYGAGFVSETGNEIGAWTDNIAIFAQGVSWSVPKNAGTFQDFVEFDLGKSGDGFWFQSRMIASEDNIAASVNTGFVYFHRGPLNDLIEFDASTTPLPEIFYGEDSIRLDDAPILSFSNNEVFAAREGLHIVKANPNQGHDVHSVLEDFTAWSVRSGAHLEYTSHYVIKNFDLIARDSEKFSEPLSGIGFASNTSDVTIVDSKIDGFREGVNLAKNFTPNLKAEPGETHDFIVVNTEITGTGELFKNYDPDEDIILDSAPDKNTVPALEFDAPLVFEIGESTAFHRVHLTGTKTDSLGTTDFPTGTDNFDLDFSDMQHILETDGFYTGSDGNNYFIADLYFSDRLTGDIYKQSELVRFGAGSHPGWFDPKNSINNGEFDLEDLQAMVSQPAELVARPTIPSIDGQTANLPAAMEHNLVPTTPEHDEATHLEMTPADEASAIWNALTEGFPLPAEDDMMLEEQELELVAA